MACSQPPHCPTQFAVLVGPPSLHFAGGDKWLLAILFSKRHTQRKFYL